MSTSLLYHGFGIRGYRYRKTEYVEGKVIFHIDQPPETLRCAACGSRAVVRRGSTERLFRHVPIGNKPVWLRFAVPRVGCVWDTVKEIQKMHLQRHYARPPLKHLRKLVYSDNYFSGRATIRNPGFGDG